MADKFWVVNASGDWHTQANWTGGTEPSVEDHAINEIAQIFIDADVAVASLTNSSSLLFGIVPSSVPRSASSITSISGALSNSGNMELLGSYFDSNYLVSASANIEVTAGSLANTGSISITSTFASSQTVKFVILGDTTGEGSIYIDGGVRVELNGSVSTGQSITFGPSNWATTLVLGTGFSGVLGGMSINDKVVFKGEVISELGLVGSNIVIQFADASTQSIAVRGGVGGIIGRVGSDASEITTLGPAGPYLLTGDQDFIIAGANNPIIYAKSGMFSPSDRIDGGAGFDLLDVTEANNAQWTFAGGTIKNVELMNITSQAEIAIITHDGNVLPSEKLKILGYANGGLKFDGSLETDGSFELYSGLAADELTGGAGADAIFGGSNNDILRGADGADTLDGQAGNDEINGGSDNDNLLGGLGDDHLEGGAGDDILSGGPGADTFELEGSNSGIDTYDGGDGEDTLLIKGVVSLGKLTLVASNSVERISYDNVDARIVGTSGADVLDFRGVTFVNATHEIAMGAGDDLVIGTQGDDHLLGEDGADTLAGGAGSDRIVAGTGKDILNGGPGADFLSGGDGDDTYYVDNPGDVVIESILEGLDTVYAAVDFFLSDFIDNLYLLTGSAATTGVGNGARNGIYGNANNNFIFGNNFNPDGTMKAGAGNDGLVGGVGDDGIFAGDGNDALEGSEGNDSLVGGSGNDFLDGGSGSDFLFGGSFSLAGAREATSGADILVGGDGRDALYGFDGDDKINGDAGDDYAEGGAGNDTVNGGAGNDTLLGHEGNDTIRGGAGFDYEYGGAGADLFVFRKGDSADWILDFKVSEGDAMRFEGFDFGSFTQVSLVDASTPGNPAVTFARFNAVTESYDQLTIFGVTLAQLNAGNVFVA